MAYVVFLLMVCIPCVAPRYFEIHHGGDILMDVEFSVNFMVKSRDGFFAVKQWTENDVSGSGVTREGNNKSIMKIRFSNTSTEHTYFHFVFTSLPEGGWKIWSVFEINPSHVFSKTMNARICFGGPEHITPSGNHSFLCSRRERIFYHRVPCIDENEPVQSNESYVLRVDMKRIRAQGFNVNHNKFSPPIQCKGDTANYYTGIVTSSVAFSVILFLIFIVVVVLIHRHGEEDRVDRSHLLGPNRRQPMINSMSV